MLSKRNNTKGCKHLPRLQYVYTFFSSKNIYFTLNNEKKGEHYIPEIHNNNFFNNMQLIRATISCFQTDNKDETHLVLNIMNLTA